MALSAIFTVWPLIVLLYGDWFPLMSVCLSLFLLFVSLWITGLGHSGTQPLWAACDLLLGTRLILHMILKTRPGVSVSPGADSQEDWVCSEGRCFSLFQRVVVWGHHPMNFIHVGSSRWAKDEVFLKLGFLMPGLQRCSAVRSACCSSRGTLVELSASLFSGSQLSVAPAPGHFTPSPTHICRQKTSVHKIKTFLKKQM